MLCQVCQTNISGNRGPFYFNRQNLKFDILCMILYHIADRLGRNFQTRLTLVFVVFTRKVLYDEKSDFENQTVCTDYT